MAWLEDALGGWSGGILAGLGALVVIPPILPLLGSVVRPVARAMVRGGLVIADGVSGVIAGVSEQVNDLIAEVRAESVGANGGSHRRQASPHR
jgi:hypothetical protein